MNNYQSEKKLILKYYSELDGAVGDDHYQIMDKYTATNYLWRGFYPFNEKHSTQELVSDFWIPFKNAITRKLHEINDEWIFLWQAIIR